MFYFILTLTYIVKVRATASRRRDEPKVYILKICVTRLCCQRFFKADIFLFQYSTCNQLCACSELLHHVCSPWIITAPPRGQIKHCSMFSQTQLRGVYQASTSSRGEECPARTLHGPCTARERATHGAVMEKVELINRSVCISLKLNENNKIGTLF